MILFRKLFFFIGVVVSLVMQAQTYHAVNNARPIGTGCYQLNPDTPNSYGAVWSLTKLDLSVAFDKTFMVNLGVKDANGADGISFTFQN